MEIQLRSEETGITYVDTLAKAREEVIKDPTIWKISFIVETGERIRLVKNPRGHFEANPMWGL